MCVPVIADAVALAFACTRGSNSAINDTFSCVCLFIIHVNVGFAMHCSSWGKYNPGVCSQVTRHNFDTAAQNIKEALEECDFIAFDCEMTGLFLDNNEGSYLDDMPLRYYKVLRSATSSTKYLHFRVAKHQRPA